MIASDTTVVSVKAGALNGYSVPDGHAEDALEELVSLASIICGAPIAFVTLVDSGRIWCKSKVGLNASQVSRIDAFCFTVLRDCLLIVPDATADERLASHPLVTFAPNLRFYAGVPLTTLRGQRIGSLCVIDTVSRRIEADQVAALEGIARAVTSQIELRRSVQQSVQAEQLLRDIQSRTESQIAERTSQLTAAHHSLQLLTRQLMQAQEDERRRIARELHDETGQLLATLSMTIDHLQEQSSGAHRARIAECKELLKLAIAEIRNLSYLLHPPLMDEVGLRSAVAEYVRGFEQRSGIRVKFDIAEELGRLERDREIALFRIIQESFVNIHRHSGSPTASLSLVTVDDAVVLEIRDHGKGFDFASADSTNFGLGIRSMQERLRTFGGTLQLSSTDAGTMVRAELPRAAVAELGCQQSV